MAAGDRLWDWDELVLAVDVYRRNEGSVSGGALDELVSDLAKLVTARGYEPRSRGSVKFKLGNIKAIDSGGSAGFSHGARLDAAVWTAFEDDPEAMAIKAARLRAI